MHLNPGNPEMVIINCRDLDPFQSLWRYSSCVPPCRPGPSREPDGGSCGCNRPEPPCADSDEIFEPQEEDEEEENGRPERQSFAPPQDDEEEEETCPSESDDP